MSVVVRIGAFSSDPSACDAFHAMDPESGILYPAINDSLVYIDCDGNLQPGLATSWRRIDPLTIELELREGVRFHNGELFGADDVVETIRAQRDPKNRAPNGQGILSSISGCEKVNEQAVRIQTYLPDGMLLNRLHIASAIYPKSILREHGPSHFYSHPIGTGAYIFEHWERGAEIVLRRNPDHWSRAVSIEELRFPIMDQKDWVNALMAGEIDIALNLDPHDAFRVRGMPGVEVRRREAALSHWFLLSNRGGPLADRRVRRALNYAVHRHLLCKIANHGWASPQASLLTRGQIGFDPAIAPYPYDPDYAQHLLNEAGYGSGFRLSGLVSESSASLYQLVRVFLEKIGVRLEADIVPRSEWLRRMVTARIMSGHEFVGDFALANIDNFTLHGLFPHSCFLHSRGIFSLLNLPEYDRWFHQVQVKTNPQDMSTSLRALDRYAHEEALLLFTISQQVLCGVRKGYDIPLGVSGHFNFDNLWRIRVNPERMVVPQKPYKRKLVASDLELRRLLEATSYPGILYNPDSRDYEQPMLAALWNNIQLHETRWRVEAEEMIRTLVDQVKAFTNLENVLRSTTQVGILGISYTGRILFENSGYRIVMGHGSDVPLSSLLYGDDGQPAWLDIIEAMQRDGQVARVLNVAAGPGKPRRVFLTATPAINELGSSIGCVCIFTDHSKEEERLRMSQEMQVAERIQTALLPKISAEDRERVAAVMVPAEEVGGDYYDIITDEHGHKWYGIGDVSGHGVTSGLIMLITHSIISAIVRTNPTLPLETILMRLNQVLYEDIQVRMGESYHLTFALIKSLGQGDFTVAGAHEDIIIYRGQTRTCESIPLQGVWFGLLPDISGTITEQRVHLDPGDVMVLYTDGLLEAEALDGTLWESEGFKRAIERSVHLSPEAMKESILTEVRQFMHKQLDDITLMIIRC